MDPWYRLGFGLMQAHGIRASGGAAPSPPAGVTIRRGGPGDLERLAAEHGSVLWRHQAGSPTFSGLEPPPRDEVLASWLETFQDPSDTLFLAEREGALIGHSLLYAAAAGAGPARRRGQAGDGGRPAGRARPRHRARAGRARLRVGGGGRVRVARGRLAGREPGGLPLLAGARVPDRAPPHVPHDRRGLSGLDCAGMPRACVIVLDAVGAGDLPDADRFGTAGSNTLGARGRGGRRARAAGAAAAGAGQRAAAGRVPAARRTRRRCGAGWPSAAPGWTPPPGTGR